MQNELEAEGVVNVQILGVNASGLESGNAVAVEGRDLPWLQDVAEVDMWGTWVVGYRDVWILDRDNRLLTIYNLTEHDLEQPESFAELKALFIEAAQR
jgi:hypothetical protein